MDPGDFENLHAEILEPQLEEIKEEKKGRGRGRKKKEDPPPKAPPMEFDFSNSIPEQDPYEMEAERQLTQGMMDRVFAYRERFKHLKQRNKINGKSTLEEVEDELHYIERQLGASNGSGALNTLLIGGMYGLEHGLNHYNPLGLNLTGLGEVTKTNISQFEPILDELIIKYGMDMTMSAEMRLLVLIGTTVFTVHAANTNNQAVKKSLEKMKQAQDKAADYGDL